VLLSFPVQIQFRAVMLPTENRVQQPAPPGNCVHTVGDINPLLAFLR
jgi:hypothetical protein